MSNEQDNCKYCNGKGYVNESHGSVSGFEKVNCICMNEQDNKPERTALQIDIERRKNHLKKLDKEHRRLTNTRDGAKTGAQKDREIFLGYYCLDLLQDIRKSEKLLEVEREKGIELIAIGIHSDSYNGSDEDTSMMATKLFDEKYGTDGK